MFCTLSGSWILFSFGVHFISRSFLPYRLLYRIASKNHFISSSSFNNGASEHNVLFRIRARVIIITILCIELSLQRLASCQIERKEELFAPFLRRDMRTKHVEKVDSFLPDNYSKFLAIPPSHHITPRV